MKLFQKLLLAPAALGLMAPLAASASELASAGGMNSYIQQGDLHNFRVWADQNQVTNVQQFNDVKPTDWAYQALSNLIERYGCVAGYPNGTFKGGQAMTRYEAAALLNACLDRVTETTDEIQRLQADFAKELTVIKGRVATLEKKVGTLESTQFSTTTKLEGDAYFTLGGVGFSADNNQGAGGIGTRNSPAQNAQNFGGTTFNYDLRLNLRTSFTGKDLLYTRLRAANYVGSAFLGNPYTMMSLDRAYPGTAQGTTGQNNIFYLDRLYYRSPMGKGKLAGQFTYLVGPIARNTEFLAVTPFYYGGDHQGLDVFTLNGAPGAYNKATGGMFGLTWKQDVKKGRPFFAASTSYVAPSANSAAAAVTNSSSTTGSGIMSSQSGGSWLTQIGYQASQWKAAFAWRYGQCGSVFSRRGTQAAGNNNSNYFGCGAGVANTGAASTTKSSGDLYSNSFAVTYAWQPKKNGTLVPSVNLGWGYNAYSMTGANAPSPTYSENIFNTTNLVNQNLIASNIAATQSWTVGLQWKDAFAKGNAAGMAVGQGTFVTATRNGATPHDGNYAWEWWYKFKMSDAVSITPLLFYLSNPSSAGVSVAGNTNGAAVSSTGAGVFGAVLQTQFKF